MSGDTMLRQWTMLQSIPRFPARITANELTQILRAAEFDVHLRTVQRDLIQFIKPFGYTSDTEGKTEYWYFPKDHKGSDVPGMSAHIALTLTMAKEHLTPLLPTSSMDTLDPYFKRADQVIAQLVPLSLKAWKHRVRVITRGPSLTPPKISEPVQAAVYEAVLRDRKLTVLYQGRGSEKATEQVLNPLGLVLREGVLYLVATAWTYPDPRHYAVHRIKKAEHLNETAIRPEGFDLGAYVEGEFRYPVAPGTLRLVIRMDAETAVHLEERPLSKNQIITDRGDDVDIAATVADTDELRWWLLGFGENAEVLKPKRLRNELANTVRAMSAKYA